MTTKTHTVRFSCACAEYADHMECEHSRVHVAVMAEKLPHVDVVMESYEVAQERHRIRDRENAMHWACGYEDHIKGARMTAEILADPEQAAALDRAIEQARNGETISQEDLYRELDEDVDDA